MGMACYLATPSQALPFHLWGNPFSRNLEARAPKESWIVVPVYQTESTAMPETQVLTTVVPTTITAPGPTATVTESAPTVTLEKTDTHVVISTVDIHGPAPTDVYKTHSPMNPPPAATTTPAETSHAAPTPVFTEPSVKSYDNGLWKTSYPPWTGQMKRSQATATPELRL